jgi:glycosyltransferase involved in cell wall biosynthesis
VHLAVLHYHLNRGGVTNVIAGHLRALDGTGAPGAGRVALIYGGRREDWPVDLVPALRNLDVSLHAVPELDYDRGDPPRPEILAGRLRHLLDGLGLAPATTMLHFHNPSLGKNVSLPGAIRTLAEAGYGTLLQIHDFAEDFRPAEYRRLVATTGAGSPGELAASLYPQAAHVHYAVLNRRDAGLLLAAGVPETRLHLLPNPVPGPGPSSPREAARRTLAETFGIPEDHRLVLYPVRGIRRKNLGEALLWSVLAGEGTAVGVTLPPLNPVEQPAYNRWKAFAVELGLSCSFELGSPGRLRLEESLAAADLVLTTSLAEGFGLVFLEPWLAGRGVVGRDLPEITADFIESGLRLPGLAPRVDLPLEWVDESALRADLEQRYRRVLAEYDRPQPATARLRAGIDELLPEGRVDFGTLGSDFQRQVLGLVRCDAGRRRRLLELNPKLREVLAADTASDTAPIGQNATRIRRHYSLQRIGERLLDLYRRIAGSPRSSRLEPPVDGERILRGFLDVTRFRPVRVEP